MFSGDGVFKLAKRMALLIVVVSVGLPLRYGSTNPSYVFIRLLHSLLSLKHSLVADRARPTLSADYRAFEDILRMRPSAELDPFLDPLTLIKQLRLTLTMSNLFPKSSRCRIDRHEFEHGGHQIDLYTIDDHPVHHSSVSDRILLYLHGGAYMVGDIHSTSLSLSRTIHCPHPHSQATVVSNVISLGSSTSLCCIWNIVLVLNIHCLLLLTTPLPSIVLSFARTSLHRD